MTLYTEGLKHIVHLFPDLTSLGMLSDQTHSGHEALRSWPNVCVDSFVEISQLRKLESVDLSGLGSITVGQAKALERAIRAQQELGLLQPSVILRLPKKMPHKGTCPQYQIGSSHHQLLCSGTAPGEQLGTSS